MPSMPIWLAMIGTTLVLLVAASSLERPIKHAVRTRWPAFNYDGQLMLALGVATLGAAATLAFLALLFSTLTPDHRLGLSAGRQGPLLVSCSS